MVPERGERGRNGETSDNVGREKEGEFFSHK